MITTFGAGRAATTVGTPSPTATSIATSNAMERLTKPVTPLTGESVSRPRSGDHTRLHSTADFWCHGPARRSRESAGDTIATMANRLAGETSPYLLQHADNP